MATFNLDERNAANQTYGGVINEDVLQQIWDISRIPLPFTELCSRYTSGNHYKEFTIDALQSQDLSNAAYDGQDLTDNDTNLGTRVGSYHQTATKTIQVSTRANAVDSIGRMSSLSYQIMMRQQELRRDIEGIMLSNQASSVGNPDTNTPSTMAGLPAWLETNVNFGVGGSAGGFNTSTGIIDAATYGTKRPLTETAVRDMLQSIYEAGNSDPSILMSVPSVCRKFSEYLFTSNARVATQYNPDQNTSGSTAYASHNLFASDFSVVKIMDNRLMPENSAGEANVYGLSPRYLAQSFLRGYRVERLAKTGLSEKRAMSVDVTLLVLNEASQGMIADVDTVAEVTFS